VHAVSYSLLLLNTDLHVAELSSRMSRQQFVRNTLGTIQMQLRPDRSTSDLAPEDAQLSDALSPGLGPGDTVKSRTKRSDSITSWNSISRDMVSANLGQALGGTATATGTSTSASAGSSGQLVRNNDSVVSVGTTHTESKTQSTLVSSIVYDRNWESDLESLLKVRCAARARVGMAGC
jgi:PH/SEC7 domain-containing protein